MGFAGRAAGQPLIDLLAQAAQVGFDVLALLFPALDQLMGHIQGGHHRDSLQADDLARVANLLHFLVQVVGGCQQLCLGAIRAADGVLLVQQLDGNRACVRAHEFCSSALSRCIIPSTLLRVWSLSCTS
eukprot:gnl/Carplike_NY0171/21745_a36329_70.p1 GENE.gnl/Carplike_NY0171/21745_a36329_70~~gnl/Carplike_NY0171/21745_a36329_70.p1  ORF type:complete len:129 (-),score=7.23 gnl/Carplike_NY0171/21745_a36329_70:205-591(-)